MRKIALAALVIAGTGLVADAQIRAARADGTAPPQPALSLALTRLVDPVIAGLWSRFDLKAAEQHVRFVAGFWRLPGNAGFDATIDRVHARLVASGFRDRTPGASASRVPEVFLEEYANPTKGWDYSIGTLSIVRAGHPDDVVLSRANERIALCINSFSTAPGGVTARLIDVGRGEQDADYSNRDVTGAVVLGDADVGQLWRRAVIGHGAIGVVSGEIGAYVNPQPPGASPTPRDSWNILQWGSIPYDEAKKGFAFKATPRAMATLRRALASGAVTVRVAVASTFSTKPARTLVAEIPGSITPTERVVLAVHVQEPGANDNASGVATLAETARTLVAGIKAGRIPSPGRTITLLWLDEIAGSRAWLVAHPDAATTVKYMFSMDMTGEDVRKTGGSFLIERFPDPGAVWERPWDPHTEWGRGELGADQLKGDLLNDLHLAVCLRVASRSDWIVNTNPYEGGSDHTVFGSLGIPSVLDWHFTDRYYHTNLDTADKSSAPEMRNVGVAAVATAWLLASAKEPTALAIADLVAKAGQARVAFEEREGAHLAAGAADPLAGRLQQDQIVSAWKKWYGEAVASVARVVVGPTTPALLVRLTQLAAPFVGTVGPVPSPGQAAAARLVLAIAPGRNSLGIGVATPALRGAPRPEALALAINRLMADRWYPPPAQPSAQTVQDQDMLSGALDSDDPAARRVAVRGLGQFEDPSEAPAIEALLDDKDPGVRREAANALAQAFVHRQGADVIPASESLRSRLREESDSAVQATVREALARLHYRDEAAERRTAEVIGQDPEAMVILLRNDRTFEITDQERLSLKQAAHPNDPRQLPSAAAIEALGIASDSDFMIVNSAALWQCVNGPPECGWEVRYAAVARMDATDQLLEPILRLTLRDAAFQVRMAALRRYAAAIPKTNDCSHLIDAMGDPFELPVVRLDAMSLLRTTCDQPADIEQKLAVIAADFGESGPVPGWHTAVPALEALARFDAVQAQRILAANFVHSNVWQVRAAAARVATVVRDEPTLVALAADAEPNVQTAAIAGLATIKSAALAGYAIKALGSPDYQLVRQAALSLQGNTDTDSTVPALVAALARLTKEGKDTSRDPRIAILTRLKEVAAPSPSGGSPLAKKLEAIRELLSDFDPSVSVAAADVLAAATGTRPTPTPTRRPPQQPTAVELRQLPNQATMVMDNGSEICMSLRADEAPLAVARFAELVKRHYYDHLTFHRHVPLFVTQGGSPGANEYMGDVRYLRDELGLARHTYGAIGLSTRGRDTGDAQIFFDLTNQPRLNYDYTVFANVTTAPPAACAESLHVMDRLLDGARIDHIVLHQDR